MKNIPKRIFFSKASLVCLMLVLCMFTTGCNSDVDTKDSETMNKTQKGKEAMNDDHRLLLMDKIHREKLQEIQYWSMKKGVAEFYKARDVSPIAEYVKSRGYGLILPPQVDSYHMHKGVRYHTLVRFVIQQKYIMNQLWCLEQVEHNNIIYEYWVMQERSQGRSYEQSFRNCVFIVTKANGLTGEREIIHSSEQFYSEYKISSDFTLVFPKKNINELRIYAYPESFQETEMEEIKKILSRLQ